MGFERERAQTSEHCYIGASSVKTEVLITFVEVMRALSTKECQSLRRVEGVKEGGWGEC